MLKFKNFTLHGLILLSLSLPLAGQTFRSGDAERLVKDSKLVRLNPKTRSVQFFQLRDDTQNVEKDRTIWLGKALKISKNHSFEEISGITDKINFSHSKHQLFYKNLPVEGGIYIVHSKAGKILSANGDYYQGNDINEIPGLTEPGAFDFAVKFVNAVQYRWEKESSARPIGELVILPVNEKYVLTYKFDIYAFKPLSRQYIFIDANSGKVIKTLNRIQDENVVGTAETMYNGTVNITTDSYSGHYRLRETGRGQGIETYDLNEGTDYSTSVDFTDEDNYWDTSTDFDKAAYDAHYGTEATYDYYYQKFNRNSFDNMGAKLKNYVHYSDNYKNAFWNGEFMTYGDGDNINNLPWTSIEIVAHEITHGVTENTAGLIYRSESGALNESFSDIFGVMVDFYKNPLTAKYKNGEAISLSHRPLRDMSNPNLCGHPDTYKGKYWDKNQEVHCNSGVQNFWYYLLCEGGTGTNDIGSSYHVNGIGRDRAAQITYRNLTVYLTPNSNYADARFYSIESATDLFGGCSAEVTAVGNAWYAVGVGEGYDCMDPQNFTAVPISISEISLKWDKNINDNNILIAYNTTKNFGTPVDGIVYSPGISIPGGGIVIYNGNSTSFNHTGLNSGTWYYYKIWSIKPSNNYSGGVSLFAKTHCEAFTLPFSEGFENGNLPDCWAQETGPPSWVFVSGNGSNSTISESKEGMYNAFLKDLTLSSDRNKLISPPLNITGFTHPVLKFWYAQDSAFDFDAQGNVVYPHDELRIYYKSSLIAPWNLLGTYTDQLDLWTEAMINLPDPSNNYYLAFEGDAKAGNGVYVDDIRVFDLNCSTQLVQASNFIVTSVTSGAIDISWTRGNGKEVLVVARQSNPVDSNPVNGELYTGNTVYGRGDIIGSGNFVVYSGTGTQVSISDLSPGSEYYFSIFEKSEDRCYAIPALRGNAITKECSSNSPSFPFFEDFEHVSFPPVCWIAYRGLNNLGTINDWIHSSFAYNSKGAAFVDGEQLSEGFSEDWLVTPRISIPEGPEFSLSYFEDKTGLGDHGGQYYIKISTHSQNDRSTFVDLIKYGESTFGIGYTQRSIDLSGYAGQSVYIAFVMVQNGGNGWFIDNVSVDNSPPVTNVTWLGTTSTDWDTGTNWSGEIVPDLKNNVIIPSGCMKYPRIDEMTSCNMLTIQSGGSIILEDGGRINVQENFEIGTGTSGNFKMEGGNCLVKGDVLTSSGSSVVITRGEFSFSNWAVGNSGTLQLSGGIINVSGSVHFNNAHVIIDGPSELNIGENYFAGYNIAISDGTINLLGTGISQYFYFIPFSSDIVVRANNLTINAPNKTYILTRRHGNDIFLSGNLTIASGTAQTYNGTYNLNVLWLNGNVTIEKGALLAWGRKTSGGIQLGGNWINHGGSFMPGHSLVLLNGTEQKITGQNTFYDLFKKEGSKLTFGAGVTNRTEIEGTLDLDGYPDNLLSLRSETDGAQWEIDVQGTTLLNYVDVKDSKNINAEHINACNLVNSGNNTNWDLPLTNAGLITGTASVCKGSLNINFTVPAIEGATSYIWTLPDGTTGTSTTNIISISFSDTATSGEIKVKGHNECGDGEESKFVVTVSDIPVRPEITFNTGVLNSSATNGNQWYFNNQPLQNAVNQTLIPESDGDYFVVVRLNGCSSQPSNIISCTSTGIREGEIESGINVYPNPATDVVKIAITNKFDSDFMVDIYDNMGIILKTMKKSSSEILFDVDFSKFSAGYYILSIYNKHKNYHVKVVKK